MMRSLFSGISGLRVHQTRMDVIGHNIANVNTIGYKASRATFSEVFSQTSAGASPANPETGRGGTNPMQIGLGVNIASIDKIMTQGAAQRTDNPFDLMIQGEGFFIVGDASGQYFTRNGALNLDANGNLVTANGMTVMGWNNVDPETGRVVAGVVQPIQITPEKEFVAPNPTRQINLTGNLNAINNTANPKVMSMTIFDSVGTRYVVDIQMQYRPDAIDTGVLDPDSRVYTPGPPDADGNPTAGTWGPPTRNVMEGGWITSILPVAFPNGDRTNPMEISFDREGNIMFTGRRGEDVPRNAAPMELGVKTFYTNGMPKVFIPSTPRIDAATGLPERDSSDNILYNRGVFAAGDPTATPPTTDRITKPNTSTVDPPGTANVLDANFQRLVIGLRPGPFVSNDPPPPDGVLNNHMIPGSTFGGNETYVVGQTVNNALIIDFSNLTQFGTQGSDAITNMVNGNAPGTLNGISIGTDGTIIGRYSNGQVKALAQIPVAFFKNPAGLEKVGDSLYVPTGNSGEFNGTGDIVAAKGGSLLGGVLEMSNVDLSNEFVEMITTQRGFQANSRIISTSDEMLVELVNLKR